MERAESQSWEKAPDKPMRTGVSSRRVGQTTIKEVTLKATKMTLVPQKGVLQYFIFSSQLFLSMSFSFVAIATKKAPYLFY